MTKKLRILVDASYEGDELNNETVSQVADHLTRKELKEYIRALKDREKKMTLRVEVPNDRMILHIDELKHLFGAKKVTASINPDLLLGVRITDNDDVYNMNMKHSLERIIEHATE